MATVAIRKPLAPRLVSQPQIPPTHSPVNTKRVVSAAQLKRPRSPTINEGPATHEATKRSKHEKKEKKISPKELIFRSKYTKAFPEWTFYFDTTNAEREDLGHRVLQLNAKIAKFFSNEVTHFITNKPIPEDGEDKENSARARGSAKAALRSPIKLRGMPNEISTSGYEALIKKARSLGMKIWDTAKLDSVLERCGLPGHSAATSARPPKSLNELLETERRFGTTTERDPSQKRHDFHYFARNSYFVLVEDMRQEYAPIIVKEYPIERTSDGKETGDWPVPHCHPRARGPFFEYTEKEDRKRKRQEKRDADLAKDIDSFKKRIKIVKQQESKHLDLRRSASLNNLRIDALKQTQQAQDDSAQTGGNTPSGFLDSGYIAASGNSVGITSTFGTTSTSGLGGLSRNTFPPKLRGRLSEVITSRRVTPLPEDNSASRNGSAGPSALMAPPAGVPQRAKPILRKSKSTNTVRLPKRNEDSKPGYCESCRAKFDDFKSHIRGQKHRAFAENDANFLQLDLLLQRVKRRTRAEVEAEKEHELVKYTRESTPFSPQLSNTDGDVMDSDW